MVACGHKVEKNIIRKERTHDVLSVQKESGNGKKYSGKATSPNKQKGKNTGKRHNRVHPGHFATQQGTPFYPAGMSAADWSTLVFTLPRRKMAWVHPVVSFPQKIYTSPVLFSMPTSYQQWVWEREAHISWSMVTRQSKAALVRNCVDIYWPCAGELSAVYAIDTQLRDPINSGLTRWRMAVLNK